MLSVISSDGCARLRNSHTGDCLYNHDFISGANELCQVNVNALLRDHPFKLIMDKVLDRGGSSSSSAWHLSINTHVISPYPNTGSPKSKPNMWWSILPIAA
ncbi:hypothetical protein NW764_008490 [Fusarium oxysporum]|nr:hypothetical protein NW764_008490 [Fusarium oxysporum]